MEYSKLVELYEKLESTSKRLPKTYEISELIKRASAEDMPHLVLLVQGRVFPQWDEREIGVASKMVMKAIASAAGISAKKVEEIWKKKGDLGGGCARAYEKEDPVDACLVKPYNRQRCRDNKEDCV